MPRRADDDRLPRGPEGHAAVPVRSAVSGARVPFGRASPAPRPVYGSGGCPSGVPHPPGPCAGSAIEGSAGVPREPGRPGEAAGAGGGRTRAGADGAAGPGARVPAGRAPGAVLWEDEDAGPDDPDGGGGESAEDLESRGGERAAGYPSGERRAGHVGARPDRGGFRRATAGQGAGRRGTAFFAGGRHESGATDGFGAPSHTLRWCVVVDPGLRLRGVKALRRPRNRPHF